MKALEEKDPDQLDKREEHALVEYREYVFCISLINVFAEVVKKPALAGVI